MSERTDVLVIGGGISGLVTAWGLAARGVDVRVVEASERVGGVISSERVGDYLIELGPNTVLATSGEIARLIEGVGLAQRLEWADDRAARRYIVRRARLVRVPGGPGGFLTTRLFSLRAKLRLFKEPWIAASDPDLDESLAAFVLRRLGPEFLDYAINPMVAGVYAGRPEDLEVRSAFPKVHALEQRYGSLIRGAIRGARERKRLAAETGEVSRDRARLMSFPDGLGELPRAVAAHLGARVRVSARATVLTQDGQGWCATLAADDGGPAEVRADRVVLALPVPALLGLIDHPDLRPLREIPWPPVAVVYFGYATEPGGVPRDGFGHLVPAHEVEAHGFGTLGTLWTSSLFPGRCPAGGAALTTFVGGMRQPDHARLPDDELVALVQRDVQRLMGISAEPDLVHIGRWPEAIPQYILGHRRRLDGVARAEAALPGLHVAANVVGGVSVGDRIRYGAALAARLGDRA